MVGLDGYIFARGVDVLAVLVEDVLESVSSGKSL